MVSQRWKQVEECQPWVWHMVALTAGEGWVEVEVWVALVMVLRCEVSGQVWTFFALASRKIGADLELVDGVAKDETRFPGRFCQALIC
jgi:hypothetical protein